MIYVIQENTNSDDYRAIYAGSSAHEALLAASKLKSCRITLWKRGKKYVVTESKGQD